jgi:hypothetical protein
MLHYTAMKIHLIKILFFALSVLHTTSLQSQKNKQKFLDSSLEANSVKWKAKLHKGMFGLSKPEFGPYVTQDVAKLDSPVFKRRTKDSSYSGAIISSESWDWDFSKYETVENAKAYGMKVVNEKDTAEFLFSIYRISKEKNITVFGELMSKHDEDKNALLGYKTILSGLMTTSYSVTPWRFLIEDTSGKGGEMPPFDLTRITRGYIVSQFDSIPTEPVMANFGKPGD